MYLPELFTRTILIRFDDLRLAGSFFFSFFDIVIHNWLLSSLSLFLSLSICESTTRPTCQMIRLFDFSSAIFAFTFHHNFSSALPGIQENKQRRRKNNLVLPWPGCCSPLSEASEMCKNSNNFTRHEISKQA